MEHGVVMIHTGGDTTSFNDTRHLQGIQNISYPSSIWEFKVGSGVKNEQEQLIA